jgi:hypothetical protein
MDREPNRSVTLDFQKGTLRRFGVSLRLVDRLRSAVPLVQDSREDCFRCNDKNSGAVLCEVVTNETRELQRSRNRRRNSAYRSLVNRTTLKLRSWS